MANVLQGGFHPVSEATARYRRYPVANNYNTAIFRGDLVVLVTGGTIELATAGGATLNLGAVKGCSYWSEGKRVFNSYVPANTTFTPTTVGSVQETWVYVYDDPATEYWASVASHAGTDTEAEVHAAVGSNMDITAGAGSTVYGQSGHVLDGNPIAGIAQMRINEVRRIPSRDLSAANWQARCQINEGAHPTMDTGGI